jgi:hypothetical protein
MLSCLSFARLRLTGYVISLSAQAIVRKTFPLDQDVGDRLRMESSSWIVLPYDRRIYTNRQDSFALHPFTRSL